MLLVTELFCCPEAILCQKPAGPPPSGSCRCHNCLGREPLTGQRLAPTASAPFLPSCLALTRIQSWQGVCRLFPQGARRSGLQASSPGRALEEKEASRLREWASSGSVEKASRPPGKWSPEDRLMPLPSPSPHSGCSPHPQAPAGRV